MAAIAALWVWVLAHKVAVALIVSEVLSLLPEKWVKSGGLVDMGWRLAKKLLGIDDKSAPILEFK